MPKLETRKAKLGPSVTRNPSVRDFTDLEVWRLARDLRVQVYSLLMSMPPDERFALAQQLRRAALSITANIAEGFGRYSYQENIQFCRVARGSAYEVRDLLIAAAYQKYIPPDLHQRTDMFAQRVIQTLNGYIRSTKSRQRTAIQSNA